MNQTQTIFRISKNKKHPYVMIDRSSLLDKKLSWKAKGILAYLLSLPDDWKIYISELSKHASNGKESLYTGIQELVKKRYIKRLAIRNKKGQMKGYDYIVYEKPYRQNPDTVKPDTGNQPLLNNKKRIKNNNIVEDKSIHREFDVKMSNKLENTIRKKRKLCRKVNKKQWIHHFYELRIKYGFKKKIIKTTLTWYCKHFGEEFVPEAYSAKGFCDKFIQIGSAMGKQIKAIEKGEQKVTCRKIKRKKK